MNLRVEFLKRVRLNTIQGHQVFFPIPFVAYSPLVHSDKMSDTLEQTLRTLDITRSQGYFDNDFFTVCSFYNEDYQTGTFY